MSLLDTLQRDIVEATPAGLSKYRSFSEDELRKLRDRHLKTLKDNNRRLDPGKLQSAIQQIDAVLAEYEQNGGEFLRRVSLRMLAR